MEMISRITAYFAYPVRGANGDNATKGEMRDNLEAGKDLCDRFRNESGWTIFCPHDAVNEDVCAAAYHLTDDDGNPRVTGQQIVNHCKQILALADVFILGVDNYNHKDGCMCGVCQEWRRAKELGIPVYPAGYLVGEPIGATAEDLAADVRDFEIEYGLRPAPPKIAPTLPAGIEA